jgi:hypothetical protein
MRGGKAGLVKKAGTHLGIGQSLAHALHDGLEFGCKRHGQGKE